MCLRLLLALAFVLIAACSDPRAQARDRLHGVDRQHLRLDAARLYKQLYAATGPEFIILKQAQWPEAFRALKPIRIGCYRDGFSLALADDSVNETGLHIQPLGITHPPIAGKLTYERLEEGIYWYSLKK